MRSLLVVAAALGIVPVLTVIACREPAPVGPVESAASASAPKPGSASAASVSAAEPKASSAPTEASASSAPATSPSPVASALPKSKTAAECKKTIEKAQSMGDEVVARHSKCQSDGDCVTVRSGVCLARCDTAIAKTGVGDRDAVLKKAQPLCDDFMNSDCIYKYPVPVPSCPAFVARCKAGACKAEVK